SRCRHLGSKLAGLRAGWNDRVWDLASVRPQGFIRATSLSLKADARKPPHAFEVRNPTACLADSDIPFFIIWVQREWRFGTRRPKPIAEYRCGRDGRPGNRPMEAVRIRRGNRRGHSD